MKHTARLLETAKSAALNAGGMLKARLAGPRRVTYKGEIDVVTEADKMAEQVIVAQLRQATPDYDFLAEESATAAPIPENCWIIDPLDGTTNYVHRYPVFCVSIALRLEGREVLGVVYNPMLDELFHGIAGEGAFLNGVRIRCSGVGELDKSLLATGFPYDIRTNPDNNLIAFAAFSKRVQAIRRAGAAALDLAYLAMGRFDGFWELRLQPWDTAAGALLVQEAGGLVTTLQGSPFRLDAPHVLASNGLIHEEMLAVLATDG